MLEKLDKDALIEHCKELDAKLQWLVNQWPGELEDGGITFPDGDFYERETSIK